MEMENDNTRMATGLVACAVSSLFFGSMFVPIKRFNPGDGFFAQWIMCCAILMVGFVTYVYEGFPEFYPLAMLGGAFWTIGNATAIPIIRKIGMALGMLIWNTTNCLTGWATGRFGMFGMKPRPPKNDLLNYIGLGLVLIGGALFSQVRADPRPTAVTKRPAVKLTAEAGEEHKLTMDFAENEPEDAKPSIRQVEADSKQRIMAIVMALIAGLFYGVTFVPVIHIQDNPQKYPGASPRGLPYVFSHYFGIFLTSTVIFLGYCIVKTRYRKNRPYINRELVIPAFGSGLLWAIAQTSFFVANEKLSQTVTFPIIATLPGCIAAVWSVFVFHEIRGARNLKILGIAIGFVICGILLVGISKDLVI